MNLHPLGVGSGSSRTRLPRAAAVLAAAGPLLMAGCSPRAAYAQVRGEAASQHTLPALTLTADDTPITRSCRIEIPPGVILKDANKDGVLHVAASDITIEFGPGATLRGADPNAAPDTYEGYGIRIAGQRNVTIRGGRISGFRAGIWASDAPGLTLESIDASDNRRMHLYSTAEAETPGDWLYPHNNDTRKWLDDYGAALYVERSDHIIVRDCKVWHGQNALCLDRVNDSRIYDNDFSFNSGWGIALWRSCRNVICRNACDFCIRGYSHGVYNRGQDSAGLLFFEQDSDNIVAENSATHGGDGFFGYAGHAAMAQSAQPPTTAVASQAAPTSQPVFSPGEATGVGCDRNLLIKNDFSYAAAHGIELTFSFDNRFLANRLVGNAICGIWAGYSQSTLIAGNEIAENGQAGYGLERGGVNIDSSRQNRILNNAFRANVCGVHLWWHVQSPDRIPWAQRNLPDWSGNLVAGNVFDADELTFHFRGAGQATLGPNELRNTRREIDRTPDTTLMRDANAPVGTFQLPPYLVFGQRHPVGARAALAGREHIIMTEWGPWDHASPIVLPLKNAGAEQSFALYGFAERPHCSITNLRDWRLEGAGPDYTLTLSAHEPGLHPYKISISTPQFRRELAGALLSATWDVTCFSYAGDPSADPNGWRALADRPAAQRVRVERLDDPALLNAGLTTSQPSSAPSDAAQPGTRPARTARSFIARTRLPIPPGDWQISVRPTGGIRVTVDQRMVIDAWRARREMGLQTGQFTSTGSPLEITLEYYLGRRARPPVLQILPAEPGKQPD